MPEIGELNGLPPTQLYGALLAGIEDISQQKDVSFATYTRRVLPLDGFVFWIRTGAFTQTGVIHHTAERMQSEDETATTDRVVFTSTKPIVQLNASETQTLVVGNVEGTRYAFRSHGMFMPQAGIWHYGGDNVVPALATQLIDDPAQLDERTPIVTDSLPAWLSIATYAPIWLIPSNPAIPLYPSFAVPDNLAPPYGTVHNEPEGIRVMATTPLLTGGFGLILDGFGNPILDGHGNPVLKAMTGHSQLAAERVRVVLYGCDNQKALAWLDTVLRYSYDTDRIGLMNMLAVRDDKRTWPEGMILAQKKVVDFEVSWVQSAIYDQARILIAEAQTAVIPEDPSLPINPAQPIVITS